MWKLTEDANGEDIPEFEGSREAMGTENAAIWARVEQVRVLREIRDVLGQMDVSLGEISSHTEQ